MYYIIWPSVYGMDMHGHYISHTSRTVDCDYLKNEKIYIEFKK